MTLQWLHETVTPKTQKARGIKALHASHSPGFYCISGLQGTPQEVRELFKELTSRLNPDYIFARPCPRTPRHGFVESRLIKTAADLEQILKETYAADPRGEMLYTHKLDVDYSAVVTDTSLSIGPGHDGATTGKHAVTLDVNCDLRAWVDQHSMSFYSNKYEILKQVKPSDYAGLKPQSRMPFIEFIDRQPVQLRYGPKLDTYSGNWIPLFGTTAEKVLYAEHFIEDMLAVENVLTNYLNSYSSSELALDARGYSLSSHLAIQCISHGIAVFTTKPPCATDGQDTGNTLSSVPATLQHQLQTQPPWEKCHLNEAVALIQATAATPPSEQRTVLLYLASELLIRAAIGACIAEHRHFRPECHHDFPIGPMTLTGKIFTPVNKLPVRSQFYKKALAINLRDYKRSLYALGQLTVCERDFNKAGWAEHFGGEKWAYCTQATSQALQAWLAVHSYSVYQTRSAVNWPSLCSTVDRLVGAMNILINVSHNGGKCLTKFILPKVLDGISLFPAKFLITPHIYHVLTGLKTEAIRDSSNITAPLP